MSISLLSLLLVLYFVCNDVVALIQCKKCDYDFVTEEEVCEADCMGTLCFYSEYYYTEPERVFTRKGCISGATDSNGCRINQDGQILCLCDEDKCNENQSTLKEEPPAELPYQVCMREMENGLEPPRRWTPPCAGNFCVYKKSTFTLDNGTVGYSHSKDCSNSNDFDLFYTGLPFLFYPECCAKLAYGGQPEETICYGTMPDDSAADFSAREMIECHADYMSRHLPYIPFMKLCQGHFCVIAASPQGDVYRGCLTVDESAATRQIEPGYYQSYNGMEQWICDTSNCNFDMQRMEESWPEEMADFKNISRLNIQDLFEAANTASTTTIVVPSIISLCIFTFFL